MLRASLVLLLASCIAGQAAAVSVHFVDAPSAGYLRPGQQGSQSLSAAELSVALGSLLSFETAAGLSEASAAKVGQAVHDRGCSSKGPGLEQTPLQVDSLLTADVFNRPSAVLALQLAGVSTGTSLLDVQCAALKVAQAHPIKHDACWRRPTAGAAFTAC